MQTYSHIILTALLNQQLKAESPIPVHSRAFLVGSFAPDVALSILMGQFLLKRLWKGSDSVWCGEEFNNFYFNSPVWIISHNLLHAPFLLVGLMVVGYVAGTRWQKTWGWTLLWFAIGCGLHTLIDIPTHHDDGPLVLFPFDTKFRVNSPISYWDRGHGARVFGLIEHLFDIVAIGFILKDVFRNRHRNSKSSHKP